jgi:hypothetical protein
MARREPCPNMPNCRMYAVFSLATTLQIWKDNYCTSDFMRCERYKQTACGSAISDLLLPNGHMLKKV